MRSRYSRFAMSQILSIDVVSYGLDEDLLEGGLHDFEAIDACAALDGGCEEGLGVRGETVDAVKLDLGLAAVVLGGFDAGGGEEGVVALEGDLNAVSRVAAFDFAHAARENEMAARDEGDCVADLLDLVHAVCAEEDGLALFAEVDERVHEKSGVNGV